MKTNKKSIGHRKMAVTVASLAVGWLCWSGGGNGCDGFAQNAPANLSPPLLEVVKLAQAHMSDDIITSYIKNSGASYNLSADDIIYLGSQNVSQNVIAVLQQRSGMPPTGGGPAPMTPAPAVAQPPMSQPEAYVPPAPPPGSDINLPYFQAQLSPYGTWVELPPYGLIWRPNDAALPGWRPYFNQGHWEYTDAGWFWHSDAPYGDIVFHYGRWQRDFRLGWAWVPGYDWAPAWVSWRQADGYAGWAPLPPGARYELGVGLMYHGGLAVGVDYGLGPDDYVFVGYDHFWDHDYRPFLLPRERFGVVFRGSLIMNEHRFVDGRLVFDGLGRDRIGLLTHHPVVETRITFHDPRIERGREMERTRAVERVNEIRSRPMNDPMRQNLERSQALHKPDEGRGPTPDRAGPGARVPDGGRPLDGGPRGGPGGRDGKEPGGRGDR